MPNKQVTFDSVNLNLTTNKITVNKINLSPDNSGDWTISVDFALTNPVKALVNSVSIIERNLLVATVLVTRSEIAQHASITEQQVVDDLSILQLEGYVTQIALTKIFASLGINPQNIVIS